jgi:hypothetical protein
MSNNACSPMSRRGLLQLGMLAVACGAAGCGNTAGNSATPAGKPALESGSLKTIEKLKRRTAKPGVGKT